MKRLTAALFATLVVLAETAWSAEVTTFESCTDLAGRTLAAQPDRSLPTLVATVSEGDEPAIRYNPTLLPRLSAPARLFFFAHECARNALGDAGKPALAVARSREADCVGLTTLLEAGLLRREDIPALQADLVFTEQEWALLPGLPRQFDLARCSTRGVLQLPAATPPTGDQAGWNACIRICGNRLWACGTDEGRCMEPYRQCSAACGERPGK